MNGTAAIAPPRAPAVQAAKPSVKKPAPELEAAEEDEDVRRPPPKAKSKMWLFLLLGGVAALFLFCLIGPAIVVAAYLFMRQKVSGPVVNGPVIQMPPPPTEPMSVPPIDTTPTRPVRTKPTPPANTAPKPPDPTPEPDDDPTGPKLDADPLREPLQAPSNPGGNIPLAGGNPGGGGNNPVRYPWGPGPIVAVQSGKNNQWEVWNLQSMTKLGSVPGSSGADVKLSSDGAYLAMPTFGAGIKQTGLEIFSVTDGKSLRKVPAKGGGDSTVGIADFAGPGLFLQLHNEGRGGVATVTDVKSGDQSGFKTVGQVDRKANAVSPGGRYLAMYDSFDFKHPIQMYEIKTGKVVGTIKPKLPQGTYYNCVALTFSNDGKELAALIESDGANYLQAWDFEVGKRVANHKFTPLLAKTAKAAQAYLAPMYPAPLEYLPDRSGWLAYGQLMIDHDRGKVFWSLPPEDPNVLWQRRFLDADHLITVMVKGPRQRQLEIITLPKDEIAAARRK